MIRSVYAPFVEHYPWGKNYLGKLGDVAGRAPHSVILGAVEDGEVLGCITLELATTLEGEPRPPEASAHTRMLAVAVQARGKGIGKALMVKSMDLGRDDGRTELDLFTMPTMEVAQAMYDKMGFERNPEQEEMENGAVSLLAYRIAL